MVREEMRLTLAQLPESQMQSLWRGLDVDNSGWISAGEFGRFMRLVELKDGPTWQERVLMKKSAAGSEVKRDLDVRTGRDMANKLANVPPAADYDLDRLSQLFNKYLVAIAPDPAAKTLWFRLFKHMDDDDTGRVSYKEFAGIVREELRLGPSELGEGEMQARTARLAVAPAWPSVALPLVLTPRLSRRSRSSRRSTATTAAGCRRASSAASCGAASPRRGRAGRRSCTSATRSRARFVAQRQAERSTSHRARRSHARAHSAQHAPTRRPRRGRR
jgi:Ca2+-binding EF-hand superfamily protein